MNNTALYAEQKWQKIVQQTEPVIATIENGSFTSSDLTKLASLIGRQSELASALFKKEVQAFKIQAESFTSDIVGRLHGIGVDATVGNIQKVIEKIFKLEIKRNLNSLMQKMKDEVSKQVNLITQTAKTFFVEKKENQVAKESENEKVQEIVKSIIQKLDVIPTELKKIVNTYTKPQPQQNELPVIVENTVPNTESNKLESKIENAIRIGSEKISAIKNELKNELKSEIANRINNKPQIVKERVIEKPQQKPLLSKVIENSKVLSDFTSRVKTVKEKVIEKSKTVVNNVITKAVSVKDNVKSNISEYKRDFKDAVLDVKQSVNDAFQNIKNATINNPIAQKIEAIGTKLYSIFPAMLNKISPIAVAVQNGLLRTVKTVRDIKRNIGAYIRRKTQGLRDAISWVKNVTVDGWRKTKDFVSSIYRKLGDGFDFLMPIVGMGAMLYPMIKGVFTYFMENFNIKDFLIKTFNSMFPSLSNWLQEHIPFLKKNEESKEVTKSKSDDGYTEVVKDKDGKYKSQVKYDYNPEPIKEGKYKGWIKTKSEADPKSVNGEDAQAQMKTVEFVNKQTGEVAREYVPINSDNVMSEESLYKGPEKAVVKGESGKDILERGKHVIFERKDNKNKTENKSSQAVKPVTVKSNAVKPKEATTKAPDFKKEKVSIEKPKVNKETKKEKTENNPSIIQPINLNTTTKAGKAADSSIYMIDGDF